MDKERYIWLVSRKLSGVIQPQEEHEFYKMLDANPELRQEFHLLERFWDVSGDSSSEIDMVAAYHRIQERIFQRVDQKERLLNKPGRVIHLKKWLRGVAAILIFFSLGGAVYWFSYHSKEEAKAITWETRTTPKGKQETFELADGTKIRLNVGSTLRFPSEFPGDERQVFLSGEAYFEVKRNEHKPFKVFTNSMIVRVLGTVFDVRAYPGDREDEATLVRGSIQVTLKHNPSKQIVLKPNEKLVVKNEMAVESAGANRADQAFESNQTQKIQENLPMLKVSMATRMAGLDSTVQENAWVEKKLAFRDEDFTSLVRQMERWYNVQIEIKNKKVKEYRFSGIFTHETVEQALRALQLTEHFTWEINRNKIIINQ